MKIPITRFLRTMFTTNHSQNTRNDITDVTLSVWNVFHSREQRRGFMESGLSVHWIGNHYPPESHEVQKRSFAWLSFAAMMSYFYFYKMQWLLHLSMTLFDWYSGSRKLNTKLVWAFVEMNTRIIRKAKKQGIPIVLDNPIAHMRDYYEILKPEYNALGMDFHEELVLRWVHKAEQEYAVADWFNVGSNFVKSTLVKHGIPEDKINVIHYGVDVTKWSRSYCNRKVNTDRMVFVYTAAISPRKGIQYLIRAWIHANLSNAELIICGSGTMPWSKICTEMPSTIKLMGAVRHDTLADLYSSADVFVLPSLLEGFARSGVEAMSAGLALIVTEETGLGDVCKNGVEGWIIPSRDVASLSEKLQWCNCHREEVRNAGRKGYEKMKNMSFSGYGKQCADLAKRIIEAKPSDPNSPQQNS